MLIFDKLKVFIKGIKEDNSKAWKRIVSGAAFWVIVSSVLIGSYTCYNFYTLKNACKDQFAAEYWGSSNEEKDYGKVSVFARGIRVNGEFTPAHYQEAGSSLSLADITSMRNTLQGVVDSFATGADSKNKGLNSDGTPRGWEDCYSTFLKASICEKKVDGTTTDPVDIEVVAVGGNFSACHPMEYLSGGFLPELVIDNNQIVINDVLAWRLYRSYDVLGENLMMWGETFTIIGVVRVKDDGVVNKSDVNDARAYCYFSVVDKLDATGYFNQSGNDEGSGLAGTSSKLAVNCYEVILPESVRGVAYTDVLAALPSYSGNDPKMYVVRNTGRFGLLKIYDLMMPIGEESKKLAEYEFPFWEDAAQITTQFMFIDMCIILVCAIGLFAGIIMASLKYYSNKQKNT